MLATTTALAGSLLLNYISKDLNLTHVSIKSKNNEENLKTTFDIIADILRNLIPKNIIKATTHQEITKYINKSHEEDTFNATGLEKTVVYIEGTNLLGLLVFALLLGLASSILDKKADIFRKFFKSANEVMLLILKWFILLAPIGLIYYNN